eukprot:3275393-Pleurochrysis_carterae.AAC.2
MAFYDKCCLSAACPFCFRGGRAALEARADLLSNGASFLAAYPDHVRGALAVARHVGGEALTDGGERALELGQRGRLRHAGRDAPFARPRMSSRSGSHARL